MLSSGNQIRANKFAWASEKRQSGKADESWWNQTPGPGIAYRLQKNFPAEGPQNISDVDEDDSSGYVKRLNSACTPKARPIKASPMLYLKINEHAEAGQHHCRSHHPFLAHCFLNL